MDGQTLCVAFPVICSIEGLIPILYFLDMSSACADESCSRSNRELTGQIQYYLSQPLYLGVSVHLAIAPSGDVTLRGDGAAPCLDRSPLQRYQPEFGETEGLLLFLGCIDQAWVLYGHFSVSWRSWITSALDNYWCGFRAIVEYPLIDDRQMDLLEVTPSLQHPTANDVFRHVVTALTYSLRYPFYCLLRMCKSEKEEPDDITLCPPNRDHACKDSPAEGRLKGETFVRADYITDHDKHQATSLNLGLFRLERIEAGRQQVGVYKPGTVCLSNEKFAGEGSFARTVRAGNDQDLLG